MKIAQIRFHLQDFTKWLKQSSWVSPGGWNRIFTENPKNGQTCSTFLHLFLQVFCRRIQVIRNRQKLIMKNKVQTSLNRTWKNQSKSSDRFGRTLHTESKSLEILEPREPARTADGVRRAGGSAQITGRWQEDPGEWGAADLNRFNGLPSSV